LAALEELSLNLRWSWDHRTRDLFHWVDPDVWAQAGRDPVRLLSLVSQDRLAALAVDPAFLTFLREVHDDLTRYVEADRWFQGRTSSLRSVAYFSPEFGIAQALPQYSGGLGVLAGDHLKAASGLGVPLVGVGLLYRQGYFRQELDSDGWQQERYVSLDPQSMAVAQCEGARVHIELADTTLVAQVWQARVGRIALYLLDSVVEENDEIGHQITDRLYGGDTEHRLLQEVLLGVGGVRALELVGEAPQVFHTNEGHAGFLGLERIRRAILDDGLSFNEAVEAGRASTVFTTHTPVPAGIDRFPRPLMERCFKRWADECGVDFEDLMALGHETGEPADAPFNMAVMGLRLAGMSNGVSRLHGEVSRRMFSGLWPGVPPEEVPIGSITNGVHAGTWVLPEMRELFDHYVLPEWHEAGPERWARLSEAGDDELWRIRNQAREQLVAFARRRLRESGEAQGLTGADVAWSEQALDPRALTIGFARRFATYKRATLLLSQPERLSALLLSEERPVQLLFSGKAHPADETGKNMIRELVQFARRPELRHRVAFIEDYDIDTARALVQGCDVWLNNPRRPLEACGTSGQKAALNGGLNCSVLDGWWDEWFDGDNGWAIASAEKYDDLVRRDEVEAASLFDLLERQIVPLFYDREDGGRPPSRWLERVRASLQSLGPLVSASRMVRDYVEALYEPAASRGDEMGADNHRRARALAAWKSRVAVAFGDVAVVSVETDPTIGDLGGARDVTAVVALGELSPDDVEVQLLHGRAGPADDLVAPTILPMTLVVQADSPMAEGHYRYDATFLFEAAGRYGFTARVVPAHPDLSTFAEMGRVAWA